MLKLNQLKKILKPYGLRIENTKRGRHPFKVKGRIQGTSREHIYPLKIHGRNPEISKSYLNGIIEEFHLPEDEFDQYL